MLLVPPLLAGALRGFSWELALLLAAALALFTASPAAMVLLRHAAGNRRHTTGLAAARRWAVWWLAAALASGLPLLVGGHWRLLAFLPPAGAAFVGSFLLSRRSGKTALSDVVAMAGLTLTGPAALAVADGGCGASCLLFYAYNLLFFGGSVFYVHMKMHRPVDAAGKSPLHARVAAGRDNLLYQAGTLSGVGGLALAGAAPLTALVAFLPMAAQAVAGTYTLGRRVRFKRLGFLLLGHSLLFGLLLGVTL